MQLVTRAELLWVVDALGPAQTHAIAEVLPIDQNSAYVRLRHLKRSGSLESRHDERKGWKYEWTVTDAGRQRIADADLPDAETTDFEAYFANRAGTIDPLMLLEALAVEEGEWHPSGVLYDALPFSKAGIRKRLRSMTDDGLVELDPSEHSEPHRWRVTEAGHQRLADAQPGDREYSWLSQ